MERWAGRIYLVNEHTGEERAVYVSTKAAPSAPFAEIHDDLLETAQVVSKSWGGGAWQYQGDDIREISR